MTSWIPIPLMVRFDRSMVRVGSPSRDNAANLLGTTLQRQLPSGRLSRMISPGDICSFQQDGQALPGVAQVAKQEGHHAATNVLRSIRGVPLEPFRYRDYGNMATIGRGSAVAQIGRFHASGFFAWLIWLFIHIFWLIGFRNRLAVLTEWGWSYVTLQRRVRLITGGRLWPGS